MKKAKPASDKLPALLENYSCCSYGLIFELDVVSLQCKTPLLDYSRTEFSNNLAENAVQPFAVGRKNWLFCNTVKGANASAVIYSLIETAKANGLKPFEYLSFLLETIPTATTGQLDDLLPWGKAVPEYCWQAKPVKENA